MNDNLFRTLLKRYEADIEDALYKITMYEEHRPSDTGTRGYYR